jgi:hypothetical protein
MYAMGRDERSESRRAAGEPHDGLRPLRARLAATYAVAAFLGCAGASGLQPTTDASLPDGSGGAPASVDAPAGASDAEADGPEPAPDVEADAPALMSDAGADSPPAGPGAMAFCHKVAQLRAQRMAGCSGLADEAYWLAHPDLCAIFDRSASVGRLAVDATAAGACLERLRLASCDRIRWEVRECGYAARGLVPPGQACRYDYVFRYGGLDCASDGFCDTQAPGVCACRAYQRKGDSCAGSGQLCSPDLLCAGIDRRCMAESDLPVVHLGERCSSGFPRTDRCDTGLVCLAPSWGGSFCFAADHGRACTGKAFECARDEYCANGRCVLNTDGPCGPYTPCAASAFCLFTLGSASCAPKRHEGEPCQADRDDCAGPASCGADGRCHLGPRIGESCAISACVFGHCVTDPVSHVPTCQRDLEEGDPCSLEVGKPSGCAPWMECDNRTARCASFHSSCE